MTNVPSVRPQQADHQTEDATTRSERTLARLRSEFADKVRRGTESNPDWWDDRKRDFESDMTRAFMLLGRIRNGLPSDRADLVAGLEVLLRELDSEIRGITAPS